jgi:hypothetical protein
MMAPLLPQSLWRHHEYGYCFQVPGSTWFALLRFPEQSRIREHPIGLPPQPILGKDAAEALVEHYGVGGPRQVNNSITSAGLHVLQA